MLRSHLRRALTLVTVFVTVVCVPATPALAELGDPAPADGTATTSTSTPTSTGTTRTGPGSFTTTTPPLRRPGSNDHPQPGHLADRHGDRPGPVHRHRPGLLPGRGGGGHRSRW